MFNKDDVVTIYNDAGKLEVKILKPLPTRDISTSTGSDALPDMSNPRVEVHYNNPSKKILVTVTDANSTMPADFYICEINLFDPTNIHWYLGRIDEPEKEGDYFTTII